MPHPPSQPSTVCGTLPRGLKRNATLTVHSWRAQAELASQTDMIFTVNALTKDMACETYGLKAYPLPAELNTMLGLNMFWHRSRNTHPMLVWARGLFRQVVGEFLGLPAAAAAAPRSLRVVAEQDLTQE